MAELQHQDIVSNIIARLPLKSIARFRCVSKAWCKLLKDPKFVQKRLSEAIEMNKFSVMIHPYLSFHPETYTLAYDPSSSTSHRVGTKYLSARAFWGTINGVICLTTIKGDIVLWNPTTMEFKEVPTGPVKSVDEFSYFKHGFGYDDMNDDFKVVSFMGSEDVYSCEVQVYTLKSNSWKRLDDIPYLLFQGEMDMVQVSVHGALHWLALTDSEMSEAVILSFDFMDDRFDEMPVPNFYDEYLDTNLCPLGGSLCFLGSVYSRIDIWEMKEYGVTESWVKLFTINQAAGCPFIKQLVPLQFVKNGEVLLGYDNGKGIHLGLCDLKRGTSIEVKTHINWDWYAAATFVYVESLVPLNSGTYVVPTEIWALASSHLDIVSNILVRLPVKSILRFRCVSKAWCKLLKDPYFAKRHLHHSIDRNMFSLMMHSGYGLHKSTYNLAYDPATSTLNNCVNTNYPSRYKSEGIIFRGTCNGLVCLSPRGENAVVLWNPATKEYKNVPIAQIESCPDKIISFFKYGFGYDDELDDFKVVSIAGFEDESRCEVQVYTLGSDSWRRIEDVLYEFGFDEPDMARVSVNGAMHWIVKTDSMASETNKVIVSFEFKGDRFNDMPLPSFCDQYSEANLCSLGGSLCLLGSMHQGRVDVWEMKDYGVTESWAKMFTIEQATICEFFGDLIPLQFVKSGQVLLGYDTGLDFRLDLYDIKRGASINLKAHYDCDSYSSTTSVYVESLVSLNSGTYVGQHDDDSEDDDDPEDEDSEYDDDSEDEDLEDDDDSKEDEQEDDDDSEEEVQEDDDDSDEEEQEGEAIGGSSRAIDLGRLNSGTHVKGVERGDSKVEDLKDRDDSEEEETRKAKEARDTGHANSCELLDSYGRYLQESINLKRRKLDLETRRMDFEIRVEENRHMSMDMTRMNALQLKWWQMRANQIEEKRSISYMSIGDFDDDKVEDSHEVEQEEDIENRKKKTKMM